jgi:Family of unknown function (DUF5906)
MPVRNPGAKFLTGVIVWGLTGSGKSLLGEGVGWAIYGDRGRSGRGHYRMVTHDQFFAEFQPWIDCALWVVGNDVIMPDRKTQLERIKSYVTGPTISWHDKNVKQVTIPNYINWWFTADHEDATWLNDDDRRFNVYRTKGKLDSDDSNERGGKIYKWFMSEAGQRALMYELTEGDLLDCSDCDVGARAIKSEAKTTTIEASQDPLESLARDLIEAARETEHEPSWRDLITSEVLLRIMQLKGDRKVYNNMAAGWGLKRAGAVKIGRKLKGSVQQVSVHGIPYRVFAMANIEFWQTASSAEIHEALKQRLDSVGLLTPAVLNQTTVVFKD